MTQAAFPTQTQTERFVLRAYRAGDGQALADATRESYEHLKPFMEWAEPNPDVGECEERAQMFAARFKDADASDLVIGVWSLDEGALLGGSGYHFREGPISGGCAEIGMWIHGAHAGKGLGRAVLHEMIRWGFTDWPLLRLSWRCNTGNVASVRCALAAGMKREGTLRGQFDSVTGGRRDTACFAILREEFFEHRSGAR